MIRLSRLWEPGVEQSVYIVAELSANHNQQLNYARDLIQAAKDAGANAIKVQTYTPGTITLNSDKEWFRIHQGTIWDGQTLYDLYQEAAMPWQWQPELQQLANGLGLEFFSSPFDSTAVDFLESLQTPAYKLASFELVDIPLIEKIAATGKPMILSTGMATLHEIEEAIRTAHNAGARQLALLKCTSEYPALPEDANLRTIPDLVRRFQIPVGLSDHTLGIAVPIAAVALGARIIEKHLTLRRDLGGPDNVFSLEPPEFKAMVETVRTTEKALGEVTYGPIGDEVRNLVFRRSLFAVRDVRRGEEFTEENVRSIRPGHGLHTRHLRDVIGRRASRDIERGTPLSWELLEHDG